MLLYVAVAGQECKLHSSIVTVQDPGCLVQLQVHANTLLEKPTGPFIMTLVPPLCTNADHTLHTRWAMRAIIGTIVLALILSRATRQVWHSRGQSGTGGEHLEEVQGALADAD